MKITTVGVVMAVLLTGCASEPEQSASEQIAAIEAGEVTASQEEQEELMVQWAEEEHGTGEEMRALLDEQASWEEEEWPDEWSDEDEWADEGSPVIAEGVAGEQVLYDGAESWGITLDSIDCHDTVESTDWDDSTVVHEPQGQFCIATMTMENTGMEPESVTLEHQVRMFDAMGREFTPDDDAQLDHDSDSVVYGGVQPGQNGPLIVVFDLPVDADPAGIIFSAFGDYNPEVAEISL